MNILVAPLNWGLGHATRCVPIIDDAIRQGHRITLGSDGVALEYLKSHYPNLPFITLPHLDLHYSNSDSQIISLITQMPHIIRWIKQDNKAIDSLQKKYHFDLIISDNRFGLHTSHAYCVYITHQLHIMLPNHYQWAEPLAERWHRRYISRYDECWIPDFQDINKSLAGDLSHPQCLPSNVRYIGPLSRFSGLDITPTLNNKTLAVISGLEPQRTLFEHSIQKKYAGSNLHIINGLKPFPTDSDLAQQLVDASLIISRSGYSSIMDYHALGILYKAHLIPTPGQPEQEYLFARLAAMKQLAD